MITTELGGGGRVPAPVHRLAWSGLTNVLRHVGVLEGEVQTRASLGLPPAVILDGRDPGNIVVSPEDGMFEAILEPGDPSPRATRSDGSGSSTGPTGRPEVLAPLDGCRRRDEGDPRDRAGRLRLRARRPDRPRSAAVVLVRRTRTPALVRLRRTVGRLAPAGRPPAHAALGDTTFRSLRRHRNYRLYYVGNGISFIGTWMQLIAAYWLILDLTDSPVAVGALALVLTLPVTLVALVGGSIADRVDLRRMVICCESVLLAQAALLCVLALTGLVAAWQLYALGLVYGIAVALDAPARHTLVFQIVGPEDITNAVGLSSSLGTTARIVGPALGGVVVATFGPGVAFGLNALSYAIVIGCLLAIRLAPRPPRTEPLPGIFTSVAEALRFAVSSRRVAVTFFTVLLVGTFSFNFDVLLPLVAKLTLDQGARTYGLIASVFGCGALCGALILATVGKARLALVLGGAAGFGALPAPACPAGVAARDLRPALLRGHLLRALGLERPRDAAPRGAGRTCAAAPRASTSSPSWAGRRSAA